MKIVFASNNKNKIKEIKNQLPSFIELVSLEDIGCFEDIPETALTIEGNAQLKANYVTEKYQLPCFADDTGLEITSLNNEPGVYSARYAGEAKDSNANIDLVLKNLKNIENRKARFKTVIALNINNHQHLFTGIIKGTITEEKIGEEGFGYDSIFKPIGFDKTFGQMSLNEKSKISHRGKAVEELIYFLNTLR